MDTVPDEKLVERVRAGEKGLYEVPMRRVRIAKLENAPAGTRRFS